MFSSKTVILFTICVLSFVFSQDTAMEDFFRKASKNIPRIGRSNSKSSKGSNDDFENFFLKASKSVPRIGRRDRTDQEGNSRENVFKIPNRIQVDTDKSASAIVLPLSELTKYDEFLDNEDILNAYDILGAAIEKERPKRTAN